jgi:predicted RNase H-like nuclease (RuvC/YqgF family)
MRTVGIDEASGIMGISKEALRKRILRGSIDAKKDDAGYWRITLNDTGQDTGQDKQGHDARALIEQLQRENENLWQELYRKDTIIMNLTESVKLLGPGTKKPSLLQRVFNRGGDQD